MPKPSAATAGLSDEEAAERLRQEGYNELPQGRARTLGRIALEVGSEPMFQLLIAAGGIYLVLGDLGEALMLLASAIVTVGISIIQERRTETVIEALRDLTSPRALVIRGGERKRIAGREVVRGDIILLAEGDRVPADAVLVSAHELLTDESLLTGESAPVRKQTASSALPARPGGDDLPFVFAGSMVVRGHGTAEVHATGANSEIGKIGKALGTIASEPTPLHTQTRRIVRVFATAGLALSAAVVILYGLMRGPWLDGILAGITLAMSMLPEEFPLVLTVFLVMGAWRISRERVLTRRPATIATLGAATVLCTDKTGTLTVNQMSIAELDGNGVSWRAGDAALPELLHPLLELGILASEREPFDPMEKALRALGQRCLGDTEPLYRKWVLAHEYALSPALLAMSHVWKATDSPRCIVAAKGAPEAIADLCHLSPAQIAELRRSVERMAGRGMRVLGVASTSFEGEVWPETQHGFQFQFVGLVGLADPLRDAVPQAMNECRNAGIKVAMITGDYPATARAIAEQAGIDVKGGVITGDELARLTDEQLQQRIIDVRVFARIMPEQKLRIVNAFKAKREIVAMTGDGVNDAPSLKSAHIGIAMGGRGTDVAREASSLVLLDDDFASIVKTIRLGRRIYDNLLKAMRFILAVHVPIAGLSLLPILFGWPLVFTPVHIAFLEVVIDPMCSIVFEAEGDEPNVMRRNPRNPEEPLFSWRTIAWSLFQGCAVLAVIIALFGGALNYGLPESEARALAFVALVLASLVMVLVNRATDASVLSAFRRPNPALWYVAGAALMVLALAVYVPAVRELFRFGPMHADDLAAALISAMSLLFLFEAIKRWLERPAGKKTVLGSLRSD